jgi:hypothetical protein
VVPSRNDHNSGSGQSDHNASRDTYNFNYSRNDDHHSSAFGGELNYDRRNRNRNDNDNDHNNNNNVEGDKNHAESIDTEVRVTHKPNPGCVMQ